MLSHYAAPISKHIFSCGQKSHTCRRRVLLYLAFVLWSFGTHRILYFTSKRKVSRIRGLRDSIYQYCGIGSLKPQVGAIFVLVLTIAFTVGIVHDFCLTILDSLFMRYGPWCVFLPCWPYIGAVICGTENGESALATIDCVNEQAGTRENQGHRLMAF
jgi:hypothetical protein